MPAVATHPSGGIPLARIGDVVLFLGVLSGSVVMFEPAPYDVVLLLAAIAAFLLGLPIPRAMGPLVILILLFNIGGILALTVPMMEAEKSRMFVAVSLLLAVNAVFFAATVAADPTRLKLIVTATTASAVIAAMLGIAGYLLDIEALMKFGRAKGAFKDPNVFGPFLILPILVLARDFMTRPLGAVWYKAAPLVLMLAAVLFSFSRAAWFLAAAGLVMLGFVVFLNERRPAARVRLIAIAAAGAVMIVAVIAIALSVPEIRDLLLQRAKLTQDYDSGPLGRLNRHWIGFLWATELPLGLGPLDFAHYFTEDPHNVYLKAFLGYGWLGGISYAVLAIWTLLRLTPVMFRVRPWQGVAQCVWVTLVGHTIVGWIIDSDHWRHFFLLWGLAWGMIALDHATRRRADAPVARPDGAPAHVP